MPMNFNSLDAAFSYIEGFTNFEKITPQSVRDFKHDRMYKLLEFFGHPESGMELCHIAGSKGKGSTGIFLASILAESGCNTGLYTSPHVLTYRERITRAGEFFSDGLYIEAIESVAELLESGRGRDLAGDDKEPTTFELLTLLAFLVFRKAGCTHAVIETGIGGRLDATNVISPKVCIITPIELEHTDILGTTIEEIASEKAGIIKEGVPVFSGFQNRQAASVLRETAEKRKAPLFFLEEELESLNTLPQSGGTGMTVCWKKGGKSSAELSMFGDFQVENAALALRAALHMGFGPQEALRAGLKKAVLPGRMEIAGTSPPLILDGAHTPSSLRRLCRTFQQTFPESGICIYGNVSGKRTEEMAEIAASCFQHIIVSTPGTFKKSDPVSVFRAVKKHHASAIFEPDPEKALNEAYSLAGGRIPILVTGSFYMIGEIKKLLP